MPRARVRLFHTLLLLAWTGTAAAQALDEEELALAYGDKATVSIATGSRGDLRRAPAVATVITAEDIKATGATGLDEVLESVPGMHVARNQAYFPIYTVRGIFGGQTNPQVLTLQNGIPMTTLYRGDKGQYWGDLPLENVARIEIIRGPGSALYGADAFAGVINIITKTAAQTPGTEFGGRAGSFNTRDAWVQHGGKLGDVDVAAYLRLGSTDGSRGIIRADAQTARDARFGTHASLAPGPVNTGYDAVDAALDFGYGKWRLRADYKLRDNLGTGAGIGSALDPVGKNRGERFTADLSWSDPRFAEDWAVGVTGSFMHYAETLASNYILSPPGSRFSNAAANYFPNGEIGDPDRFERQLRLSAFAGYTGFRGHSLRMGLGHEDLNLYKTATTKNYLLNPAGLPIASALMDYNGIQPHLLPQRRKLDYLYAQDEWNFAKDWTLTAGLRRDDYSDFGAATNPRLAVVWDAALDLTAKLLYGKAFRAPSFNEQYGINPVANGNPSLKPEKIRTVEAAFSWQARRDTQLNLSLFRYLMWDTIRAVPNVVGGAAATYANTGKQNGHGAELELVWDINRAWRLTGNYARQRSVDEATNADPGYAPRHRLYARADWHMAGSWLLSPQINWVADRKRAVGDARPDVADYTSVDVTLRAERGTGRWGFAGSIRNLFNAKILEPSLAPGTAIPNDLPMPGRSFYLQATYSL